MTSSNRGTIMKFQGTPKLIIIAIILAFVLFGAGYIGYTQFFTSVENNALKIEALDIMRSVDTTNFTITVTIKNTGRNDITSAELNFILIKDNDIIDSQKHSLTLQTSTEDTYHALFSNVPVDSSSTYKAITTIYLDNMLLDTKTITKQFS
jgi:hypothetical protein